MVLRLRLREWIANWPEMTWKIEKHCDSQTTTIRLLGRMQVQHLQDLQMLTDESGGPKIALDLEELMSVDLEAVRFLDTARKRHVAAPLLAIHQGLDRERTRQRQIALAQIAPTLPQITPGQPTNLQTARWKSQGRRSKSTPTAAKVSSSALPRLSIFLCCKN